MSLRSPEVTGRAFNKKSLLYSILQHSIYLLGLTVSVELGSNLMSVFLVTYLPTILINIINQATNYLETESKCDLLITVNVTCMMVLASVYLSVSTSLPSTPAIKPVEVWLLFNLAYPFLVIITNILLQVGGGGEVAQDSLQF